MIKKGYLIFYILQSCTINHNEKKKETVFDIEKKEIFKQDQVKEKSDVDNEEFLAAWTRFVNIVAEENFSSLSNSSFDSLKVAKKKIIFEEFVKLYYAKVFNSRVKLLMKEGEKINFIDFDIDQDSLLAAKTSKHKIISNVFKQAVITIIDSNPDNSSTIVLEFAKTETGYKFFGCDEYGSTFFQ